MSWFLKVTVMATFNTLKNIGVLFFGMIMYQAYALDDPLTIAQHHTAQIKAKLIKLAQEEDNAKLYSILETTRIHFSGEMDASEVAFSSIDDNDDRLITISNAYIANLAYFIQERLSPVESIDTHQLFMYAFSDVLLHELGHHALDAFYNDYTPPQYIPMYEEHAQDWAEQIKMSIDSDEEGYGRIVSLAALLDLSMSHSEMAWQRSALGNKVDTECAMVSHTIASQICTELIQEGVYQVQD